MAAFVVVFAVVVGHRVVVVLAVVVGHRVVDAVACVAHVGAHEAGGPSERDDDYDCQQYASEVSCHFRVTRLVVGRNRNYVPKCELTREIVRNRVHTALIRFACRDSNSPSPNNSIISLLLSLTPL